MLPEVGMHGVKQGYFHRNGWLGRTFFHKPDAPSASCCASRAGEPEGKAARVNSVRGCDGIRSRLCALGFTPGVSITVYEGGGSGCRVQVRDTCVVLDPDSAGNILCDTGSGVETVLGLSGGAETE